MEGLQKLLKSKKFWVAVFGLVTVLVNQFVPGDYVQPVLILVGALIAAYSGQDIAGAATGNKELD